MKSCCSDLTVRMQEQVELGNWLKLFLSASPFVLLLPDLTPGGTAREVAASIAEKMAVMTGEKALKNIESGIKKPDFADAIIAADHIILGTLSQLAASHIPRHVGSSDGIVWQKLAQAYSPELNKKPETPAKPSGSMFPWLW